VDGLYNGLKGFLIISLAILGQPYEKEVSYEQCSERIEGGFPLPTALGYTDQQVFVFIGKI